MTQLTLKAHAKLNLALAVGPPQPPRGFHPICSWFMGIDLHDTLSLERVTESGADRSRHNTLWSPDAPRPSPIDWPIDKDLAVRAHRLLEKEAGRDLSVAMTLTKRIPVGGGLGGGSSDAAAMLVGLNLLFELGLSPGRLRELSAELGSDVAFFIDDGPEHHPPRPAIVSGYGEVVERTAAAPLPEALRSIILMFPPFGCPTGPVYAAFDKHPDRHTDPRLVDDLVALSADSNAVPACGLFNDLLEPACEVQPALRGLIDRLNAPAHEHDTVVHLTGSGSTLFALVSAGIDANDLLTRLRSAAPECALVGASLI